MTSMKIKGAREVAKKLDSLDWKVARKIQGGALKKIMTDVQSEMENTAPFKTGNYKANFTVTQSSSAKKKATTVRIKNKANHAHLVELGHRIVVNRGPDKGKDTGKRAAANPVMRSTYKKNKEEIVNEVVAKIREALRSSL